MNNIQYLNPIEEIEKTIEVEGHSGKVSCPHIKFDEAVNKDFQYKIIRRSSHDGTLLFTSLLIGEALMPLVKMQSIYKPDESKMANVKRIEYSVGNVELETEYKQVTTPAGKFPGVMQTVSIPVRCNYIFKGNGEK